MAALGRELEHGTCQRLRKKGEIDGTSWPIGLSIRASGLTACCLTADWRGGHDAPLLTAVRF